MTWQPPETGARATWTRTITAEDVEAYASITGDRNPLHFDPEFAGRTRMGEVVVHGGLTAGLFNALVAQELPGPGSVFLHQEWDYPAPVRIGDTVTAEAVVIESRADKPITRLRCVAARMAWRSCGASASSSPWCRTMADRAVEPAGRWSQLALLSVAVLLVLGTWFSGSAVATSLSEEWGIDALGVATLTVAVQLGFATGALGLAVFGVPDVVPARWLIAAGAGIATLANHPARRARRSRSRPRRGSS